MQSNLQDVLIQIKIEERFSVNINYWNFLQKNKRKSFTIELGLNMISVPLNIFIFVPHFFKETKLAHPN